MARRPDSPEASARSRAPSGATPIRGTLAGVTDTTLTVSSPSGEVRVRIVPPLRVFTRAPSDLAHVTPTSFVGITSVAQPDGSQRATEIHLFPEELRGTGEGSRLMAQTAGSAGRSTMTNGTVAPSRMTNGTVSGSRMTNGTVRAGSGGTSFTVEYQGGSQTIAIPPGVTVTAITPTQEKLSPGASVVVLTSKTPDGSLSASTVMLSGPAASPK
jgi:hypothetical protein